MANNGINGNGMNMKLLVWAVLGSVALIFIFVFGLIVWGGVNSNDVLPLFIPGVFVALAFLWKSFQDRETARLIKEARQDIAAAAIKVDTVAKTTELLGANVLDLKGAVDGMTTRLVVAEVGKERAEGETKAAELALDTAKELADAQAAPVVDAEVQDVNVINTEKAVPVDVINKPIKKKTTS